jgi:hypothetical protein
MKFHQNLFLDDMQADTVSISYAQFSEAVGSCTKIVITWYGSRIFVMGPDSRSLQSESASRLFVGNTLNGIHSSNSDTLLW